MEREENIEIKNSFDYILNSVTGLIESRLLYILVKHKVPEVFEDGLPKTYQQVAEKTQTSPIGIYKLLRYFTTSIGLFEEDLNNLGTFKKTPKSSLFTSDKYATFVEWCNNDLAYNMMKSLDLSIETGEPQCHKSLGVNSWWDLIKKPGEEEFFKNAMKVSSSEAIESALKFIDFSPFKKIVDIGGSHGRFVCEILEKYPNSHGINFDLESFFNGAGELIKNPRLEHKSGNFFESVPEGDCYILKRILHDWKDEDCIKILETIGKSILPGGKVIIFDCIINPKNYNKGHLYLDVMMFHFFGSEEKTIKQFSNISDKAGFKIDKVVNEIPNYCLIISKKD
ncbi:O-methyltransferase family 2 protein [Dictyostelium discoideum AX4]|uniref:O-methyltransferase 4 n=1 Tax=Dictyostelium discoideum TaxID=44689 RepID=OMT4_DICDI|nr:O-methyltransferase family 2 protein [Dictyostelium discoideum AX4]Q86I40.1 RecName: Full=O-methyltransferase 4 [Dictyostelium discoideum]EAL69787.1 O-methyltransferase family 2 protein [Dictyostelium discoideum AX4]|eukprot:XP_643812.1 O-methyltransferase family 2 protein [Dictyostelium discoideum AX4]